MFAPELIDVFRRELDRETAAALHGLRRSTADTIKGDQRYMDGLERARAVFDDVIRRWEKHDEDDDD